MDLASLAWRKNPICADSARATGLCPTGCPTRLSGRSWGTTQSYNQNQHNSCVWQCKRCQINGKIIESIIWPDGHLSYACRPTGARQVCEAKFDHSVSFPWIWHHLHGEKTQFVVIPLVRPGCARQAARQACRADRGAQPDHTTRINTTHMFGNASDPK